MTSQQGRTISWRALGGLLSILALTACGGGEPVAETPREPVAKTPPPAAAPRVPSLTPLSGSAAFPEARLRLDSLQKGQRLAPGSYPFDFSVTGYTLGTQTNDAEGRGLANSAQGQHIHLLLNNKPYSAHYEPNFKLALDTGYYVALAFLSRSYHESIKTPGAATLLDLTVGEVGRHQPVDLDAPHLFYSRPKGVYEGAEAERVLLDFYLMNVDLSADGYRVRATLNDREHILDQWMPYVMEGLPFGTNNLRLELIDANGDLVPGPYNRVDRQFELLAADLDSRAP